MNTDRLDYYRSQILGVPAADLSRKIFEALLAATDEAAKDEREACAALADGWAAVRKSKYGGAALRNFAAALRGEDGACANNKSLDEMLADAYAKGRTEEREACANLCVDRSNSIVDRNRMVSSVVATAECAAAIRARGKA